MVFWDPLGIEPGFPYFLILDLAKVVFPHWSPGATKIKHLLHQQAEKVLYSLW